MDATDAKTWGKLDFGCSLIKTKEKYLTIDDKSQGDISQFHLRNIGKLIEANEAEIR